MIINYDGKIDQPFLTMQILEIHEVRLSHENHQKISKSITHLSDARQFAITKNPHIVTDVH